LIKLVKKNILRFPKPGTNPRGVEITKEALSCLVSDNMNRKITINWQKVEIEFDPYKRWVELWSEE
jgi:hypothetical protein